MSKHQGDVIKQYSKRLKRNSTIAKGDIASRIVTLYLEKVQVCVLAGYDWEIPGLGTLKVEGEKTTKPIEPKKYRSKGYRREYKFNFARLGVNYSFVFDSTFLRQEGYEFKASAGFRNKLWKVLTTLPDIKYVVKDANV